MRTLQGKRVLITGGAAGIGRAIAEEFARHGAELVLADMNDAALGVAAEALGRGGTTVRTYVLDVTDASAVATLRGRIHADAGPVEVLVNNAGIVHGGPFLDVPVERHLATYRVNVLGLVAVTHAFLPDLIASADSHIVNIASASGYIGLPHGSTYASSKWAVIGFSESLLLELELQGHRHVHVTTVCPSYVTTGLFDGARAVRTTSLLSPERLAAQIAGAVLANRRVVRTPWLVKITPFLKGVLPFRLFYATAALLGVNTSMVKWRGRGT
jgi:short-subunit dehydrogenase